MGGKKLSAFPSWPMGKVPAGCSRSGRPACSVALRAPCPPSPALLRRRLRAPGCAARLRLRARCRTFAAPLMPSRALRGPGGALPSAAVRRCAPGGGGRPARLAATTQVWWRKRKRGTASWPPLCALSDPPRPAVVRPAVEQPVDLLGPCVLQLGREAGIETNVPGRAIKVIG